jgi:hypothetical protein
MNESLSETIDLLRRCRFLPGSCAKRFVRAVAFMADMGRDLDAALNDRQKAYLAKLRHLYRRQINERECGVSG